MNLYRRYSIVFVMYVHFADVVRKKLIALSFLKDVRYPFSVLQEGKKNSNLHSACEKYSSSGTSEQQQPLNGMIFRNDLTNL